MTKLLRVMLTALLLCAALWAQESSSQPLPEVDHLMEQAVAQGVIPGGVVLVGHDGRVVYRKAFGWRALEPTREAMTADTIFDIASLTKPVATAPSVMKLIQDGRVGLDDPVAKYLPEFAANGKQQITIRELLTHFSGLREDLDRQQEWSGREAAFRMVMDETPVTEPGTQFRYSDINYLALEFVVEKVSGLSLEGFAQRTVFAPLGMSETRFLPPAAWRERTAPTEYDEHHAMLRGVVHDPTARRMGGVAGDAGVFSTADDLAKFAEEMLGGHRVLNAETLKWMTTPQQPGHTGVLRGLGWDIDSPFSRARGEAYAVGSFGHTGYTGTSIWIDPATHSYVILLTNRVHPNGGVNINALRSQIATAAARGLLLTPEEKAHLRPANTVKSGIDVLEAHNFAELLAVPHAASELRVALVTNQTGVDAAGRRTIDVLSAAQGVKLAAIFSPEHGIAGNVDTTSIANSRDERTGVPVYSVYGGSDAKRRPSLEVLRAVDAIVFDLADAGVRFYTYETTLGYFLEAAAATARPIFVLDRPNPLGGLLVQGPTSDAGRESFINYGEVPVRHGLTLGELARYYNGERRIGATLTVVPMAGWQRADWFDATGLTWVSPSPNLRNLDEATLYPGLGLLEMTNVSVGRGTDTPFAVLGAPWMRGAELAAYLTRRAIPGVRFAAAEFTPAASVYAQKKCSGVRVLVADRLALDAPEMGVEIAAALRKLYAKEFDTAKLDALMLHEASARALLSGADPRDVAARWKAALAEFMARRGKYLLY
ncbi:MAG: DUF1343 domain-containing protein [Acidobacteriota bacterium]|nr:DUF1343 domain-containing protein [Acidobacteriota bacterium]